MAIPFALIVALQLSAAHLAAPQANGCASVRPIYPDSYVEEMRSPIVSGALAGVVEHSAGPLAKVGVELIDEQERCLSAVFTDEHGNFDLGVSKPGEYRLRLSRDYYAVLCVRVKVKAGSKRRLRLKLSDSA